MGFLVAVSGGGGGGGGEITDPFIYNGTALY